MRFKVYYPEVLENFKLVTYSYDCLPLCYLGDTRLKMDKTATSINVEVFENKFILTNI